MYRISRKQYEQQNWNYKWIESIESNLANIGLYNVWQQNGNGLSSHYVKELIRSRTETLYQHEWLVSKSTHPFCSFYDLLKHEFKIEKYLINLEYNQRITLCKFRCRNNFLPISKTRFQTSLEDESEIICRLCTKNDIGDEYHYLFVCPFFNDERNQYLPTVPIQPDVFHLITLFNNYDVDFLNRFTKFVQLIMTIFDHHEEWEEGIC